MAFNINDLTQYFDNPALSKFSRKTKKGFTAQIGKMIPANWEFLNFGNSIKGTSYHSLRLAPMLAPNFSDLQVQEHSVFVPCRVIMQNYEDTFNYAENRDGAILPSLSAREYHNILKTMCSNGLNPIGSLLDFLGYPVYADLYDSMQSAYFEYDGGQDKISPYEILPYKTYNRFYEESFSFTLNFTYRGENHSSDDVDFNIMEVFPLIVWLAQRKFPLSSLDDATYLFYDKIYALKGWLHSSDVSVSERYAYIPTMSELLEVSGFETVISMMNAYNSYLFGQMLNIYLRPSMINDDIRYTTLPLRAYWRFHYDWNVNGNFTDRDAELVRNVYNLEDELKRTVGLVSDLARSNYERLLFPADRIWRFDFWTSLLPNSAVDNAIEIPANSTVLDLAKLSAFQKLVFKLSFSSRYRDVVWNVFKIKPSDARLQQSSVISRRYHSVGIGETLQTSQSSETSVLGNFAGRGYSSGQNDSYHIFAEEPGIVINLFSLIPFASYADALHPNIHMDDIFDIPIPDMDVLGNQPIYADLLSGNVADANSVFGFGRQYQEFLTNYDTVHGSFKTTLPYWQLTRRFGSTPFLNEEFLRMSSQNDFDMIFSVPESDHAFVSVVYNNSVTRHVHRNVRILI